MAGWIAPLKAPFIPKTRPVLSLPEKHRTNRLRVPPPSHCHINRRGSTRNEEVPSAQPSPTDFRKVLRKKHAT
jgi:hypothetical protein